MKLGLSLLVLVVSCFLLIQAQKEKPVGEETRPTVKPTSSSQEVVVAPPKKKPPVSPPTEGGDSEENGAGRKKVKPTAVVICPRPSRSLGFLVPESPLLIPFPRRARQPGRPKPSKSIDLDQLKTKPGPRPTGFPKPTKRIPKCPPRGGRFDSEDCTTITFGGPRRTALPSPLLSRFRSFFTGRRPQETSRPRPSRVLELLRPSGIPRVPPRGGRFEDCRTINCRRPTLPTLAQIRNLIAGPRPSRILELLRPSGIPRVPLRGGRKCLLYPEKSAGRPQPTAVPSQVPELGAGGRPTPPARPSRPNRPTPPARPSRPNRPAMVSSQPPPPVSSRPPPPVKPTPPPNTPPGPPSRPGIPGRPRPGK